MFRRLMASSAMAALMAAGALSLAHAQTEQPAAGDQPAAMQPADQGGAAADQGEELTTQPAQPTLTPQEPTIATAFMGQSVFSSQDPQSDNIGEVNDLIIGPDGKITHAVVGVGGFLGIGEKNVAVPFDQLQIAENENGEIRLIYAATREQLEAAEAFDRTAFDPEQRAAQEQAAAADAGGDAGGAGAGGVTPGLTPTPADQPAAGADTGAGDTDGQNDAAGADTGAPDAPAGQTTETNTTVVVQQPAAGTDAPAPAATTTVPADATTAPTDVVVAPAPDAADTAATAPAPAAGGEGFMSFDPNQIRASSMIGQEVYGPNNESIGEVSDLIVQEDGKTRAALIDVGGFLGIGEKRVSIPFDQITMAPPQPAPADMTAAPAGTGTAAPGTTTDPATPAAGTEPAAGGTAATGGAAGGGTAAGGDPAAQPGPTAQTEPVMTVAMTREQIEQLPEWQDPNEQAAEQQAAAGAQDAAGQGAAGGTAGVTPPPAAADPNAPAGAGDMAAGGGQTAAGGGQDQAAADAQTQFQPVNREMSADDLMGSAVYSQDEENLGEIGDVIFDAQGAIQAVVVDVGGFLGIGEKPVALEYNAVTVQQNGNGDIRVMVNATQDQLQNAPTYGADAAAGGQAAQQ